MGLWSKTKGHWTNIWLDFEDNNDFDILKPFQILTYYLRGRNECEVIKEFN